MFLLVRVGSRIRLLWVISHVCRSKRDQEASRFSINAATRRKTRKNYVHGGSAEVKETPESIVLLKTEKTHL